MLQEQMVAASERRRQLPAEVGAAEAESPGAPPSTALHARLLWAETQSLEAELAECRAAAAQARQQQRDELQGVQAQLLEAREAAARAEEEHEQASPHRTAHLTMPHLL